MERPDPKKLFGSAFRSGICSDGSPFLYAGSGPRPHKAETFGGFAGPPERLSSVPLLRTKKKFSAGLQAAAVPGEMDLVP